MQELSKNRIRLNIEIDGVEVDFTSHLIFPIKFSELLDEQLDEASVTLLYTEQTIIKPLTSVRIEFWNDEDENAKQNKHFLVASDSAEENPIGSGKYKHTLYLIEQTKYLEGFICRSHGYVNKTGRAYSEGATYINYQYCKPSSPIPHSPKTNMIKSIITRGAKLPTIRELFPSVSEGDYQEGVNRISLQPNGFVFTTADGTKDTAIEYVDSNDSILIIPSGIPQMIYEIVYQISTNVSSQLFSYKVIFVYDVSPPQPWNAYTVLERALYMAETLREDEEPRFTIDQSIRAKLEAIETPEFQFTQSTLREVLQGIGNYLHAEPRLLSGGVITFDFYGSNEENEVPLLPYAKNVLTQNIEQYAVGLDSTTENLVSSINYAQGVIVEPFSGGYKTVRTESLYTRITDDNMLIATDYPIYDVIKLEYYNNGSYVDITPYVFEAHDYTRMSSYDDLYPNSKAYALYYTQGEKNIQGLNFKIPNAVNTSVFSNYAIINIIRAVTGDSSFSVSDYPEMAFRLTYCPLFNARISQSKQCIVGFDKPRYLAYNQSQNIIESQYYGEHLKGVIARMGNVEKVITYIRWGLADIPKVGTLFYDENDEEYYVSTVAVEIQPYSTKISVGLSKDFNRYSEFIGINSLKRVYEVSERQASESNIVYSDYVIIGDAVEVGTDTALFRINDIINAIKQKTNTEDKVTVLVVRGYDAEENELPRVVLPVQAVTLGNSAVFVAKYEDNYQAGVQSVYATVGTGGDAVSGYWQQGVSYSDYFGNVEKLQLGYYDKLENWDNEKSRLLPAAPSSLVVHSLRIRTGDRHLIIKKGSTEIPTINYQINAVTNRRSIVIGSAFMKHLPLVSGYQQTHYAKLYILPNRLNKFADKVDLTGATEVTAFQNVGITSNDTQAFLPSITATTSGKAWALVCSATNELLFGENRDITAGNSIYNDLAISIKHKIF